MIDISKIDKHGNFPYLLFVKIPEGIVLVSWCAVCYLLWFTMGLYLCLFGFHDGWWWVMLTCDKGDVTKVYVNNIAYYFTCWSWIMVGMDLWVISDVWWSGIMMVYDGLFQFVMVDISSWCFDVCCETKMACFFWREWCVESKKHGYPLVNKQFAIENCHLKI
jgi:hypothetical protein